ncbi:MAG: hypothetical protein ACK4EY_12990 [Flavipsychrobacter sp.]
MLNIKKIDHLLRKITGISTPFLGVSWEPSIGERNIIYKLIVNLSNRRLLDRTHGGFHFKAAINSLEHIRSNISDAIIEIGPDSKFRNILEIALDDFKKFQTVVENEFARNNFVDDRIPSDQLLDEWRIIQEKGGTILSFLCYSNKIEPPNSLEYIYNLPNNMLD